MTTTPAQEQSNDLPPFFHREQGGRGTSVFVCGSCKHVGPSSEWETVVYRDADGLPDDHENYCPICKSPSAYQLVHESKLTNLAELTNTDNRIQALVLLEKYYGVI